MRKLEAGNDKIKKICETLKQETLLPAQAAAQELLQQAERRAAQIIADAEREGQKITHEALQQAEHKRQIFHSSLAQASRQAVETLRQEIESKLLNTELHKILKEKLSVPDVMGALISAIISALEAQGLSHNLSAIIPSAISAEDVNRHIAKGILAKLDGSTVALGGLAAGVQVKMIDKRMTIDISDETLYSFLSNYVRKEFRQWIFSSTAE
jgi:V/A-type H+-transporting ATPase subunit E